MKKYRNYCSSGDIVSIRAANGASIEGVVLFASHAFKDLILVALPELQMGVYTFNDQMIHIEDISTLIYTSSMMAKSEDWPVVRRVNLFEGYDWLTMRRSAGSILLGDDRQIDCSAKQRGDCRFLPMMDCAGRGLVEKSLAFLIDGSNDSKYARLIRDRQDSFVARFKELPDIWDSLLGS